MVIDKSNWPAHRPKPGDLVLNSADEVVAVVERIEADRKRNGLRRIRVKCLEHGHCYFTGNPHHSWEDWFEVGGGRLLREE